MERKSIVLLLCSAVVGSFFFPILNSNSVEMSGPNYILSTYTPSYKYLLLFIPLIPVYVSLELSYNENFISPGKLISWMPLLTLMLIFITISINEGFSNAVSMLDIGFWMSLIFSLLLALALDKRRVAGRHNIDSQTMP
jgi:hypothetical protein